MTVLNVKNTWLIVKLRSVYKKKSQINVVDCLKKEGNSDQDPSRESELKKI